MKRKKLEILTMEKVKKKNKHFKTYYFVFCILFFFFMNFC